MHERISIDSNICHGQACIKGTRIPVHQILGMLASGDTVEALLGAYPSLRRDDIEACLLSMPGDSSRGQQRREVRLRGLDF